MPYRQQGCFELYNAAAVLLMIFLRESRENDILLAHRENGNALYPASYQQVALQIMIARFDPSYH